MSVAVLELHKCGREECDPVWQTRGEMKPEDHHMQHRRHIAVADLAETHGVVLDVEGFRRDAHEVEDAGQEHATDVRVSCRKCGRAVGWDRRDIEEFRDIPGNPGHKMRIPTVTHGNVDNVRKRWNDMVK